MTKAASGSHFGTVTTFTFAMQGEPCAHVNVDGWGRVKCNLPDDAHVDVGTTVRLFDPLHRPLNRAGAFYVSGVTPTFNKGMRETVFLRETISKEQEAADPSNPSPSKAKVHVSRRPILSLKDWILVFAQSSARPKIEKRSQLSTSKQSRKMYLEDLLSLGGGKRR